MAPTRSLRPPLIRSIVIAALIATLAMGTAACGKKSSPVDAAVRVNAYPKIVPGLCLALSFAKQGKINQANVMYYDQAHFGLHALSADVSAVDRPLGDRLFREHAKVEGELSSFSPALKTDLQLLIDLAVQSLIRLGGDAVNCSGTSNAPMTTAPA